MIVIDKQCPICEQQFSRKNGLSYHMFKSHKINLRKWEIDNCGKICLICKCSIHPDNNYCSVKCRLQDDKLNFNKTHNNYIDEQLLSDNLLYQCKKCQSKYKTAKGGSLNIHIKKCYNIEFNNKEKAKNVEFITEHFEIVESDNFKYIIKCKICDNIFKSNNLISLRNSFGTHIGMMHQISTDEYVQKHENLNNCILLRKDRLKVIKDRVESYITCPLCFEKLSRIGSSHLQSKHNMTFKQFRKQFPNIHFISERILKFMSDDMTKRNVHNIINGTTHAKFSNTKPEKLFKTILNKLNVDYKFQFVTKQSTVRVWDFYIDKLKLIIEIDGYRHYIKEDGSMFLNTIVKDYHKNNMARSLNFGICRILDETLYSADIDEISNLFDFINDYSYFYIDANGKIIKSYSIDKTNVLLSENTILISQAPLHKRKFTYEHGRWQNYVIDQTQYTCKFIETFHKNKFLQCDVDNIHNLIDSAKYDITPQLIFNMRDTNE